MAPWGRQVLGEPEKSDSPSVLRGQVPPWQARASQALQSFAGLSHYPLCREGGRRDEKSGRGGWSEVLGVTRWSQAEILLLSPRPTLCHVPFVVLCVGSLWPITEKLTTGAGQQGREQLSIAAKVSEKI